MKYNFHFIEISKLIIFVFLSLFCLLYSANSPARELENNKIELINKILFGFDKFNCLEFDANNNKCLSLARDGHLISELRNSIITIELVNFKKLSRSIKSLELFQMCVMAGCSPYHEIEEVKRKELSLKLFSALRLLRCIEGLGARRYSTEAAKVMRKYFKWVHGESTNITTAPTTLSWHLNQRSFLFSKKDLLPACAHLETSEDALRILRILVQ